MAPSPNTPDVRTPSTLSVPPLPMPTPEELDDLIYFSRTGDLPSLESSLTSLCETHKSSPSTLVASCIDIDAAGDGSGNTLLHYAAANGHVSVIAHLLGILRPEPVHENGVSANLAPTVVDKSASTFVDHRNKSGNTALHWASLNGRLDVVKVLVEQGGADVTVRNESGQDAVFVGEVSGKEGGKECAEWLLRNCADLDRGVGGGGDEREVEGQEVEDVIDGVDRQELEQETRVERRSGS